MTQEPGDAQARLAAVRTFDRPVVVLAGAGTGKTALLTERVLFAILGEGMEPREVVAVTFTEKAAAEMSARIERSLAQAAARSPAPESWASGVVARIAGHEGVDEQTVRARARAVLPRIGEIRVSTIHHFCMTLLREAGLEGGALPGSTIGTETAARSLFEEEWRAFLEEELGGSGGRADAWRRCLRRFELAEIAEAAWSLAPAWVPLSAPVRGGGARLRAEANEIIARVEAVLAHDEAGAINKNCANLLVEGRAALLRFLEEKTCSGVWRDITPAPGSKLSPAFSEEVEATRDLVRRLVRELATVDEDALEQLVELVAPFVRRFRERTARAGILTFEDLLHGAARLLAADAALRSRVARGIGALLVDEFQDTDPEQIEVVLALASGEHAKKLFVVGDPKQSIYRFRGADIEAYEQAIAELCSNRGALRLSLTTNFRSDAAIVGAVNRIGAALLVAQPPFQAAYEGILPHRGAGDADRAVAGAAVEVWSTAGGNQAERRRAEAEAVAEGIAQSHDAAGRPWKDHAVLFRAMTGSLPFVRALREREIPYVVVGGTDFYRREEIVQGLALLRALAAPHDQVALLAALRSTRCAVPDAEIVGALAGARLSFAALAGSDPARFPALHRALRFLAAARVRCAALPPDEAARSVLLDPAAVGLAAASFEGAQRVVNLEKLVQRGVDVVNAGERNLVSLVARLERDARFLTREEESPLADESLDVVRMYTVHKAKGLQFPVVFVPEMFREPGKRRAQAETSRGIVREEGGAGGGGRRLLRLCVAGTRNVAELEWWIANERHEAAEFDRLLYVAMTRPMHRLVFVCSAGRNAGRCWASALEVFGGYAPEGHFGDGAVLGEGVVHRAVAVGGGGVGSGRGDAGLSEAVVGAVGRHRGLVARARASVRVEPRAPSSVGGGVDVETGGEGAVEREQDVARQGVEGSESGAASIPSSGGRAGMVRAATVEQAIALAVGTVVHRYLEGADLAFGLVADDALARLAREAARELGVGAAGAGVAGVAGMGVGVGAEGGNLGIVVGAARAMLTRFLSSKLCASLAAAEVLGREVPLLSKDGSGVAWRGTVDLVLREKGRIVVADYKTDRVAVGGVKARAASYGAQLLIYAEGVRQAMGLEELPVRRVLFVDACVAVDL